MVVDQIALGLLSAGFLAWAAVVWKASSKAIELATAISIRVNTTLDLVVARLEKLEQRIEDHEHLHAHQGSGTDLAALKHDVDTLREVHNADFRELRNDISGIRRAVNNG